MAHAPAGANRTARPDPTGMASGLLPAAERQERLFAALRAALAEETLPALEADVRAPLATMTWAQLAEIMRVTGAAAWRGGLPVPATAVPHQVLWLLAGGDAPLPRQLPKGCHRALALALQTKIEKHFESEAIAEDKRYPPPMRRRRSSNLVSELPCLLTLVRSAHYSNPINALRCGGSRHL